MTRRKPTVVARIAAVIVVVGVGAGGCFGGFAGDFIAEGEGDPGTTVTAEKRVTLHLPANGDAQRFDVSVDNTGFAFFATANVNVALSSDVFLVGVGNGAFVDDVFNYTAVGAGSVVAAGLDFDDNGALGDFSFGAAAGEFDVDADLVISVAADIDTSDATLTLGRLAPRLAP